MYFNFKLFSVFAEKAYQEVGGCEYSLKDVLFVFEYYFARYEEAFHKAHPNIRVAQIKRIISSMPHIDANGCAILNITPEEYSDLIDKHFQTQYYNCDYNINHFFSGDIRLMRYYEELY